MQLCGGIELCGKVQACVDVLSARRDAIPSASIRCRVEATERLEVRSRSASAQGVGPVVSAHAQMFHNEVEHLPVLRWGPR